MNQAILVAVIGASIFLRAAPAPAQSHRRFELDLCEAVLSGAPDGAVRFRQALQKVRDLLNGNDLQGLQKLLNSGQVANPISNLRNGTLPSQLLPHLDAFNKALAKGISPGDFQTELRLFLAQATESEDKREVQREETEMVFNPTIANTIDFGGKPDSRRAITQPVVYKDRAWAIGPFHIPSLDRDGTFLFDLESKDPVWEVPINTVLVPTPKRLLAVATEKSETGKSTNLLIWNAETKKSVKVVKGISGFRIIPGSPERLLVVKADSLSILDLQTLIEKNIEDLRTTLSPAAMVVTNEAANKQVLGLVQQTGHEAYDVSFIDLATSRATAVFDRLHSKNLRQVLVADVGDATAAVISDIVATDLIPRFYLLDTRSEKIDFISLPDNQPVTSKAIVVIQHEGPMAYLAGKNTLAQIHLSQIDLTSNSHPRKFVSLPEGVWENPIHLSDNQLILSSRGGDTNNMAIKVDLKDSSLRVSSPFSIASSDNVFPRRFLTHEGEVYAYGLTGPASDDIEIRHVGSPLVHTFKGMAGPCHLILRGQPYIVAQTDRSVHLIRVFSEAQTSMESGRAP